VHQGLGWRPVLLASGLVGLLGCAAWSLGLMGLAELGKSAAASAIAVLAWILYLKQRLGGQTGDLLGAGNQLVEAAVLLVWIAR
jgi:adenosylcobinamide-GDP ribazoletransferase